MGSRHWISSSSSPSIFVVANGTRPRVFPPCFPCALVRETCMHRTRRLTLFFLFKSHHDYSNLVPRVESFGLPKRGVSLLSTLHPRILLSLRRNQFGISVNRPLSPKEHSVSRFTVKSRSDYIADAGAGRIFTRLKGYIYIYILFSFHRSYYVTTVAIILNERKEEQRFPSRVCTMNRITRFDTCSVYAFGCLSSRSFVREQLPRKNEWYRETPETSHRYPLKKKRRSIGRIKVFIVFKLNSFLDESFTRRRVTRSNCK